MLNSFHNSAKYLFLTLLNYLIFINSKYVDIEQLQKDVEIVTGNTQINLTTLFMFTSLSIATLTLILIFIFKPFIEVYLLYFFRFTFYFMINLVSLSTIYILFRIYGYSRLNLLIYLIISSLFLYYFDKLINKFK